MRIIYLYICVCIFFKNLSFVRCNFDGNYLTSGWNKGGDIE